MYLRCYAGIGTREATLQELVTIDSIAVALAKKRWICYSGNAPGSDQQFQTSSNSQCVVMLPWAGFENDSYDVSKSLASYVCGDTVEGKKLIREQVKGFGDLKQGVQKLLVRNMHQVVGFAKWPPVRLVVCCATPTRDGQVKGGTNYAVTLALKAQIPVINIRVRGWQRLLDERTNIVLGGD